MILFCFYDESNHGYFRILQKWFEYGFNGCLLVLDLSSSFDWCEIQVRQFFDNDLIEPNQVLFEELQKCYGMP